MYLDWMKNRRVFILMIQVLLIVGLIAWYGNIFSCLLVFVISSALFAFMFLLLFKFVYKDSVSRKMNLLLIMWDGLFGIALFTLHSSERVFALIVLFSISSEIVLFARHYNTRGCA